MKGEPNGNFFRVSHEVVECEDFKALKPASKILYYTLCHLRNRYAEANGVFFRSNDNLADDTGLSKKSIVEAKKELKKYGFISYRPDRKSRQACLYRINDDV